MANCKQCGAELRNITGKVQKQFCSDTHRKAYKRAELRKSEATARPSVDELRTNGTKLPTSDNSGQPKRGKDIKCITIGDQVRSMKTMAMLHSAAVTGKPGDADYNGVCTEAWRAERGR